MPNIVISYRREDTKWIVGRIFDRLEQHYGHDNVFMDIDAISYGLDYRDHIRSTLERSDIVLAVIGPQWLSAQEAGEQRIAQETDWVRIEIETALGKRIPVIPVLIDRTTLPKPNELPEKLRDLAFRQAISIDTGVDFRTHVDRLVRAMDQLLGRQTSTPQQSMVRATDQLLDQQSRAVNVQPGAKSPPKPPPDKAALERKPDVDRQIGDELKDKVARQHEEIGWRARFDLTLVSYIAAAVVVIIVLILAIRS